MKVLWISYDPIRLKNSKGNGSASGYWKEELLFELNKYNELEIITVFPGNKMSRLNDFQYNFRFPKKRRYRDLPKKSILDLKCIIADIKPDLIHIHGTETPFGLIKKYIDVPIVISLQGFISESFNSIIADIPLPIWSKYQTIKEKIIRNSFLDLHINWYLNSSVEKEIILINKYFIGRTSFDKNFVYKNNAIGSNYFIGNEILRDEFYHSRWSIDNLSKNVIFVSSFNNPLKGFHIVLESIKYLKLDFEDIQLIVPGELTAKLTNKIRGNSYFRYILNIIEENGLQENVKFLGKLSGLEMKEQMLNSSVFVLSSFVENSSNALGEAQLLGLPCVVSAPCGGTGDLIEDNKNGVYFNRGDSFDLSRKIKYVLDNKNIAQKLSLKSVEFGNQFYNRDNIRQQYFDIYSKIIKNESIIK